MKLSELFEGEVKKTAASESARYEALKKMLSTGTGNVTQQMVDNVKRSADDLWTEMFKAKEKNLIDVHGADWWEMARKQYPITKEHGGFVVTSKFAKDPNSGARGPWPRPGEAYATDGEAKNKQIQLVKWLDGGRKKGHGSYEEDVQKWVAALDAIDKKKQSEDTK